MITKRIPRLQTNQAAAAYWEAHSFAEAADHTTEATIRFIKRPKRAIAIGLDPARRGKDRGTDSAQETALHDPNPHVDQRTCDRLSRPRTEPGP